MNKNILVNLIEIIIKNGNKRHGKMGDNGKGQMFFSGEVLPPKSVRALVVFYKFFEHILYYILPPANYLNKGRGQ